MLPLVSSVRSVVGRMPHIQPLINAPEPIWLPSELDSLTQWLESDLSGPWMLDSANTGDDRILNNGPGLQRGRGVSVNGHNQHLEVSDDAAFDFSGTNAFSLTVLMNSTISGGWDYILSKRGSNGGFFLALNHSEVKFGFGDGSSNYTVATGHTFVHGADTVLTVTYDGDKGRLYIDGTLVFTSASLGAATLSANTEDLYIGQDNFGGGFLTALVAGIHIHNTDVGQSGASWLAFQGGSKPTGLVGRWLLEEKSGTTHYDSSGNGNNATAYNSPTHSTQNLKSWQNDEGYKGAMYFDGASDREHALITLDGDFTLSGWFYSIGTFGMMWTRLNSSNNYIWPLSNTTLRCQLNGTNVDITHGLTFPNDAWCHIAVRRSGSTITVFLNAVAGGTTGTNGATWYMSGFGSYSNGSIYFDGMAHSQRAYSRALTDEEVTSLYNGEDVTGSEIYNLPGSQGTDASGNNDNTLNGVTDHLIPRVAGADEDVLGNDLDFIGSAPLHGQLSSPCGTFDGVDDFVTFPSLQAAFDPTNDFSFSLFFKAANAPTSFEHLVSWGDGSDRFAIGLSGSDNSVRAHYDNGTNRGQSLVMSSLTDEVSVQVTWDASESELNLYVDNVEADGTNAMDSATSANFVVGSRQNAGAYFFDGSIWGLRLDSKVYTADERTWLLTDGANGTDPGEDELVALVPFSEDDGTTIHDVSGNGHHGTATNITIANFWANTQTKFAHGCKNGYRLDSGVMIPGRADGLAADGNALTHPASAFNGASELDHDPYTVPKLDSGNLDGMTVPSAHALGDPVVDAAQHFLRDNTTYEDRFLIFKEALTGDDLANAQAYVA